MTIHLHNNEADLSQAAELLRNGETVAFPTETVYGLGAHALDSAAIHKIFQAKGRPSDNPLIIHIANSSQLTGLVDEVPDFANVLMDHFWPGPLTLVFRRKEWIPDNVSAGLETVGVRMPSHPVALRLLELAGVPVAAPSANLSGRPSPTSAAHVAADLDGKIAAIVDGGRTGVGVESTVLDVTQVPPVILRPGSVTQEQLEAVIGHLVGGVAVDPAVEAIGRPGDADSQKASYVPRAPGMKYIHYAPKGVVEVVEGPWSEVHSYIEEQCQRDKRRGLRAGVLTTLEHKGDYREADYVHLCGQRSDLSTVSAELYAALRAFDEQGVDRIYSETFPEVGIGKAIMNRLGKASTTISVL